MTGGCVKRGYRQRHFPYASIRRKNLPRSVTYHSIFITH
jgi:hypothetical protein